MLLPAAGMNHHKAGGGKDDVQDDVVEWQKREIVVAAAVAAAALKLFVQRLVACHKQNLTFKCGCRLPIAWRGKTGLWNRIANGNVSTTWPDTRQQQLSVYTHTHTLIHRGIGVSYIPFAYVCIYFFHRRRRLHLHSMNETFFFFPVLFCSAFFHNAGLPVFFLLFIFATLSDL